MKVSAVSEQRQTKKVELANEFMRLALSKLTVLVVNDELMSLLVLKTLLKNNVGIQSANLYEANNGLEAY